MADLQLLVILSALKLAVLTVKHWPAQTCNLEL